MNETKVQASINRIVAGINRLNSAARSVRCNELLGGFLKETR